MRQGHVAGVAAATSPRCHFDVIARLWVLCQRKNFFIASLWPLFKKRGLVVCFRSKSYIGNCRCVNFVRHNNTLLKVAADLGLPQF